jgi:transposase
MEWRPGIDDRPMRPTQLRTSTKQLDAPFRVEVSEDSELGVVIDTVIGPMGMTERICIGKNGYVPNALSTIVKVLDGQLSMKAIRIAHMQSEKLALQEENRLLKEQLNLARQEQFGTSSEQSSQVAPEVDKPIEAIADAVPPHPGKKPYAVSNAGRKPISAHIPRIDVQCDLEPDQKKCDQCDAEMQFVGDESTERVDIIPAKIVVKRYNTKKYLCRCCEKFVVSQAPKSAIPGSSYGSAGLLADIAINKFQFALPLYRLEQIYSRAGHLISRTTMANLMIGLADKLSPLYERFREHLLQQGVIHADETSLQVLKETGRAPQTKSFMWQYCSGSHADHQLAIFEYQPTRAGANALKFLTRPDGTVFNGYLQVDGYSGYNVIDTATRVGCMAHLRRKFVEVVKSVPAAMVSESLAAVPIRLIEQLYKIEADYKNGTISERVKARQLLSVHILDRLKAWLDEQSHIGLRKNLLGKAVNYALGQWPYIVRYVEDGRLSIDNNIAERSVKAFVIGRKNWLFADSVDGGNATAVLTTMVRSALANKLDPYQYMVRVLEKLPYARTEDDFQDLMPWSVAAFLESECAPERKVA